MREKIVCAIKKCKNEFPSIMLKGFSNFIYSFCLDEVNSVFYFQNSRPSSGGTYVKFILDTGDLDILHTGGYSGPPDRHYLFRPFSDGRYANYIEYLASIIKAWGDDEIGDGISLEDRQKLLLISKLLTDVYSLYPSIQHDTDCDVIARALDGRSFEFGVKTVIRNANSANLVLKTFINKDSAKINDLDDYGGFEKYFDFLGYYGTFKSAQKSVINLPMKYMKNENCYLSEVKMNFLSDGFVYYIFLAQNGPDVVRFFKRESNFVFKFDPVVNNYKYSNFDRRLFFGLKKLKEDIEFRLLDKIPNRYCLHFEAVKLLNAITGDLEMFSSEKRQKLLDTLKKKFDLNLLRQYQTTIAIKVAPEELRQLLIKVISKEIGLDESFFPSDRDTSVPEIMTVHRMLPIEALYSEKMSQHYFALQHELDTQKTTNIESSVHMKAILKIAQQIYKDVSNGAFSKDRSGR